MLSACLSDEGISLGQLNVDKKTNEITVIPQLLDIKGCIVIADAMGGQKEVVRKIVNEKKVSYVLAVKDKQKILREQILETAKMVRPSSVFFRSGCRTWTGGGKSLSDIPKFEFSHRSVELGKAFSPSSGGKHALQ